MSRCVECDDLVDPLEQAHAAHEAYCLVDPSSEDWSCRCDAVAHVRCCRACPPPIEVPGQEPLPLASTRGLVKKHSGS